MYRIPLYKVRLVRAGDLTIAAPPAVNNPRDMAAILAGYLAGAPQEHFVVVFLNTRHVLIGLQTISIGSLSTTLVHARGCLCAGDSPRGRLSDSRPQSSQRRPHPLSRRSSAHQEAHRHRGAPRDSGPGPYHRRARTVLQLSCAEGPPALLTRPVHHVTVSLRRRHCSPCIDGPHLDPARSSSMRCLGKPGS